MANIGQAVGNFLGFDPTPGFQLSRKSAGVPLIAHGAPSNPRVSQVATGANAQVTNTSTPSNVGTNGAIGTDQRSINTFDPAASQAAALRAQYGDPGQYDGQINNTQYQIDHLGDQEGVGLQNVHDQYQTQANRLNDNKAGDERNYNTGVQQNTQGYQNNRTKILNGVRSNANALQRLLGLNGAGNSSAALEQAPYAAGLQGSQDLGDAQHTYGVNGQNLDNGWQDTQKKYKNAFEDLDTQRYQGENGVRANVAQSKVKLLQDLGLAHTNQNLARGLTGAAAQQGADQYQPEIQNLLNQITQWGRANPNPVLAAQSVSATPVSLSDYAQGRNLVAQNQQVAGAGDIGANFLPMLSQKRDQFGQPISV